MRIDSSSTRITSVTCGLLALLVTALATGQTVAAAGNSLTVNQITVETRYHPGGSPGGTNQAVQAFNSDSTTVGGYTNAPRSLPHLSGISNQSLAGSNQNIAWRVRINVTSVGTLVAGFRFGMDFGLGGTFLVDGQV
ncbi:MAG: hypothetical protein OEW19_22035, partial [Acidobacteriota bacterium]|nr:hypothetical protein [Acidobacteriota bacterium]